MPELTCKYTVVRFVPNPVRNEPRNIGVIIQVPDRSILLARFADNLRLKLPEVHSGELQLIRNFCQDLSVQYQRLQADQTYLPGASPDPLAASYLDELWQRSSGRIQFSEPRAVLTRDASQECEYLFEAFVGGDAPTAPAVRRSRLKTEVKKDLRQKNLLVTKAGAQLEMGRLTAFVENPVIARGYSKAEYTVDFACLNGSVVVVETVDLRKKSPREREHETFESAFKLDDLSRELKEGFSGYTVVATPHELPDSVEGYVKILKAYSEVYMYTVEEERSAFLKKIELLTGGRSASVQSFPSDSAR